LAYDIQKDSLSLFIPSIDPARVIWNGRGSTPAEALEKYDIDQVFLNHDLERFVKNWATYQKGNLYILHEWQGPAKMTTGTRVDSTSLQPAMDLARVVKDSYEIALIKKANDISSKAHREVLASIHRFKNEAQVEGIFLDVCVSENAKQQAYAPIAASGPNAGTLHYDSNDQPLEGRQLMCLDAGCAWECYASDITRTFPLSGSWSKEGKAIYDLVERMQESCIKRLAPGVRYLDLHILAHQIAIDGLLSLGILHNGTKEEIFKAGTSRAFFPHGLGHHVGLEVHDVGQRELMSLKSSASQSKASSLYPQDFHLPVYDAKTCRSPVDPASGHLEEGMVVTVEPGIYFSTYALNMFYLPSPIHSRYINTEVVAKYLPVGGVRIEDDILITSKGYENLTTAPKGDAMLDIIRSHGSDKTRLRHRLSATSRNSIPGLGLDFSEARDNQPGKQAQPLRRAPGISQDALEPILKPISPRSSVEVKTTSTQRRSGDFDFDAFNGPSLFENFKPAASRSAAGHPKRASTYDAIRSPPKPQEPRIPMCGDDSPKYSHYYMSTASINDQGTPHPTAATKPLCRKCAILVQTIDRLRRNFQGSDPSGAALPQPIQSKAPTPFTRPTEPQRHRRPIRPATLPVPNPAQRLNGNDIPYRQSLPNLKQPQQHPPLPTFSSRPVFTSAFTASPKPDRGQPSSGWDNEFTQPRRASTMNAPVPQAYAAQPSARRLSATLNLVEEELIDAVKRLRLIGQRAEGEVRRERYGESDRSGSGSGRRWASGGYDDLAEEEWVWKASG
jgi:Xaa-Pro dipeptidase